MREPILEWERRHIAKYEPLVKEVVDEYDPIGVMDAAPDEHYGSSDGMWYKNVIVK